MAFGNAHNVNRIIDFVMQESITKNGVRRSENSLLAIYERVNADDRISVINADNGMREFFSMIHNATDTIKFVSSVVYGDVLNRIFTEFGVRYNYDYIIKHALPYVPSVQAIADRKSMQDWTISEAYTINLRHYDFNETDALSRYSVVGTISARRDTFNRFGVNDKDIARIVRVERFAHDWKTYNDSVYSMYTYTDYIVECASNGHIKTTKFDFSKLFHNVIAPRVTEYAHGIYRDYKLYLTETTRTEVGAYRKIFV